VQRPKVAAIRVRMVIPGVVVVVVAVGCGGILDFHLEAWLLKTYEEILKILMISGDYGKVFLFMYCWREVYEIHNEFQGLRSTTYCWTERKTLPPFGPVESSIFFAPS